MENDPFRAELDRLDQEAVAEKQRKDADRQRRTNYAKQYTQKIAQALDRNKAIEFSVELNSDRKDSHEIRMAYHGTDIGSFSEQSDGCYIFMARPEAGSFSMNSDLVNKPLYRIDDMLACAAHVVLYMRNRPA